MLWVRRRPITNDTSRTRSSFTNDMALVKIPQRRINISIVTRDETRACCGWFMLGIGSKSNPVRGTTLRGTRPGLSRGHLFRFRGCFGVRSARICHCLSSRCRCCRLRLPFLCTRSANPGPFIAFAFANIQYPIITLARFRNRPRPALEHLVKRQIMANRVLEILQHELNVFAKRIYD